MQIFIFSFNSIKAYFVALEQQGSTRNDTFSWFWPRIPIIKKKFEKSKFFCLLSNTSKINQYLINQHLVLRTPVLRTAKGTQNGAPLRPIVSSINSMHYETGKHLAEILSAVIAKSERHIKNTEDFVKGTSVFSYDCSGLPRLLQL